MCSIKIETERLNITPMTEAELEAFLETVSDTELRLAYSEMLSAVCALPGREYWGTNWQIKLADGQTVGGIGFKGEPDKNGAVEIGYGIDEEFRHRGYATEALLGMLQWLSGTDDVTCVSAQTEENNKASERVLLKCGFAREGYGDEGPLYRFHIMKKKTL